MNDFITEYLKRHRETQSRLRKKEENAIESIKIAAGLSTECTKLEILHYGNISILNIQFINSHKLLIDY